MKALILIILCMFAGPFARGLTVPALDLSASQISISARQGFAPEGGGPVHNRKIVFRITGLILVAGGGMMAYYFDHKADEAYGDYEKSAFTENTEALRKDVGAYDRGKFICMGLAGAGLVLIVLSF
jgi:hypothetical protein